MCVVATFSALCSSNRYKSFKPNSIMKKIFIALSCVLLLASCHMVLKPSVKRGEPVKISKKEVPVKAFEQVAIAGSFDVFYEQGDSATVRVEGPEDALEEVDIRIDGKTLYISQKEHSGIFNIPKGLGEIDVYITSADLINVEIAGSGDFKSSKKIDTDRLSLSVAGSGEIELADVICDGVKAEIAGSGDVSVHNLVTGDTKLSIAGSGDMDFHFSQGGKVSVEIAGSGDVKLSGKVTGTDFDIAGSGTIDDKHLTVGGGER